MKIISIKWTDESVFPGGCLCTVTAEVNGRQYIKDMRSGVPLFTYVRSQDNMRKEMENHCLQEIALEAAHEAIAEWRHGDRKQESYIIQDTTMESYECAAIWIDENNHATNDISQAKVFTRKEAAAYLTAKKRAIWKRTDVVNVAQLAVPAKELKTAELRRKKVETLAELKDG